MRGYGTVPEVQDPVSVYTQAGSNTTLLIPVKNPLDIPVHVDITLTGRFSTRTKITIEIYHQIIKMKTIREDEKSNRILFHGRDCYSSQRACNICLFIQAD